VSKSAQDDGKFIPAQSCGRFGFTDTSAQSLTHFREQQITSGMAQAIIHILEVVQINQQQG
jgi:hypothetical protein